MTGVQTCALPICFEYARIPGWPNLWKPQYLNPFPNNRFIDDADSPFRQDSINAYDGQYSLRVDFGDKDTSRVQHLGSSPYGQPDEGIYAEDGKTYTLSLDRKSTRLNSSHTDISRMPSSA